MVHKEIIDYLKAHKKEYPIEVLKDQLRKSGWMEKEIEEAEKIVAKEEATVDAPKPIAGGKKTKAVKKKEVPQEEAMEAIKKITAEPQKEEKKEIFKIDVTNPPKKKGWLQNVIIIILVLAILGVLALGGYFAYEIYKIS